MASSAPAQKSPSTIQWLAQWADRSLQPAEHTAALEALIHGPAAIAELVPLLSELDPVARDTFLDEATESLAFDAPQRAAFLIDHLGQPAHQMALASLWAKQDPAAAAQWSLNHSAESPEILAPIISTWAESDPMAASVWLNAQPASPARDAGAVLLISQLLPIEPDSAAAWIENLSDPAIQSGMRSLLATQYEAELTLATP